MEPYYRAVPLQVCEKIQSYMDLLSIWGAKIALTAISNEEDVARFHFGESIFALSLMSFEHGRLADVGSGAGFPGLAIKLLRSNLEVTLLEPNKKKCAFLSEVIRRLDLTNVEVMPNSFEASKTRPGELTYVTCRALGKIGDLLSWSGTTLSKAGRVALWLGEDDVATTVRIPGWHWAQATIPGSERRKIISGSQEKPTGML